MSALVHTHEPHDHTDATAHEHGFSGWWDRFGIIASALCLIDCIVLPVVSTILISVSSTSAWAAGMHGWLVPVIGVTASMAFYHSFKVHRAYGIVAVGGGGFLLLVAGEIFEARAVLKGINWVSLVGSILLISAHVKNLWMHTRGHVAH